MGGPDGAAVRLSVIVATTHPWPEIAACLEHLLPQVGDGIEVIVADGTGSGLAPEVRERVAHLVVPGASVFELRRRALALARAPIVAVTEDHCLVASDWCARILEAHAAHPDWDAIGGAVDNGSRRRLMDWANFLMTFAPFLSPFVTDRGSRLPPPANISYRREVIPATPEAGELETVLPLRLHVSHRLGMDDTIRVTHFQSHGLLGTPVAHFHNGRATTGLADGVTGRRRGRWRALAPGFVAAVGAAVAGVWLRRRMLPLRAWAALPLVVILASCHTAGAIVGLVRGPGESPRRLS